jgi:hypothetical protein
MEADAPLQSAGSESRRCCPTCGTPYSGGSDSVGCPVCLLRHVLEPEPEPEQDSACGGLSPPDDGCFDHYEIVRRPDGCFDELGRGAMASPIGPWTPFWLALKVIDASIADRADARERFLREARAAARHPTRNTATKSKRVRRN